MPVVTDITQLSTTAASNYPAGTENANTVDDYIRQQSAFIAQLRDEPLVYATDVLVHSRSGAPGTSDVVGSFFSATNTATTGGYGMRVNHTQTGVLASGFSIGHGVIGVFTNIDGGQGLASWLVAASPESAVTGWGVFGQEVNPINRAVDSGYAKRRSALARWSGGIQIVPEADDLVGGTTADCFNTTYGLALTPSSGNKADGTPAKTYNAVLIERNAVAPGGRGILASGDSTGVGGDLPSYALEIDERWAAGIYTVGATFTDNDAVVLADSHRVRFGDGSFPAVVSANSTNGTFSLGFEDGEQLRIARGGTNAVNYVDIRGSATTGSPVLKVDGSDTNIEFYIESKGTGPLRLRPGGVNTLRLDSVASQVNFFQMYGSAAGTQVSLLSVGGDTDIDLAITPKGSGVLRFGTHASVTTETVTGYITIKDAAGNSRKLAVVS